MNPAATAAPQRSAAEEPETPAPVLAPLHRDYFERILPQPPIVCGRQLLPLSIGRYRLMHRFKVAFVADGAAEATAGDLLISVLICSHRCDDFMAFAASKNFSRELDRWARIFNFLPPRCFAWPVVGGLLTKAFGDTLGLVDAAKILSQIELFQEYVTSSSQPPRYWDETEDSRTSASHWSQSIEATLREYQGWTREEINEEPLNKALWDYFKHCENHGLVRLMTDEEAAELEKPDSPEQIAEWQEFARLVDLAKAGKLDATNFNPQPAT